MSEKDITDGPYGPQWQHEHGNGRTYVHPEKYDCDLGKTTVLPKPETKICRRRVMPNEMIGAVCPECDHTDFLHGGAPNPTLSACVVCELLELRDRV